MCFGLFYMIEFGFLGGHLLGNLFRPVIAVQQAAFFIRIDYFILYGCTHYPAPLGKLTAILITWNQMVRKASICSNFGGLISPSTIIAGFFMRNELTKSARKTPSSFPGILPIMFGVLLLTSLAVALFPDQLSTGLFGENNVLDALLGSTFGGVAAGHPLVSYVLGGELLSSGVS
jgi:hypothetical protein